MHEGESRKLELEQAGHHQDAGPISHWAPPNFRWTEYHRRQPSGGWRADDAEILQQRRGAHEGGDEEQESPCRVVSRNASNRRAGTYLPSHLTPSRTGELRRSLPERMTAALLDRLTHRCQIFEMNGESYRFRESMKSKKNRKAE